MNDVDRADEVHGEETPAPQPRWRLLYGLVLLSLLFWIALFYAFTRAFA